MKTQDKITVCQRVDQEGFDYCFMHYSDFKEVKDKKFHELRQQYEKAQQELEKYIGWEEFQNGELEEE